MEGLRLVCLLPVRNAAADLPGYFASVQRFCDGIVALDDGSTDETRELLEAEPLVRVILENPRREDYRGWDDAANRNRTLAAAAALDPTWLISLDADERIDEADAEALRAFLETDALPGCAYGFRHVPIRGEGGLFLPRYQWVWRLFAYEPGQRFPDLRLHFAPVPTAIPRARWFRTTLRIQHLGGQTEERRLARFAKYLEADPGRDYQDGYVHLLQHPDAGDLRRWEPRPPGLPVLLGADVFAADVADAAAADDAPALSAVVIARDDEPTILRSVAAVVAQEVPEPFEVIVVASGGDRTAEVVRTAFPEVTVVALDRPALPGEARNAGLRRSRGQFVTFPGSHVELFPGCLAARLAAHRRGYAMVTGLVSNGTPTPAGWASYFLDHHAGLPGHGPAELAGPPGHCSYARGPLLEVGGFPEGVRTAEDTAVNRALVRRGYVARRDPGVRFVHRSPCRTPGRLVRHHFARGRGWGRLLLQERREVGAILRDRDLLAARLVRHLPVRLGRIRRETARAEPELAARLRRVWPLVVAGAVASWAGMWWEILRPAPGKGALLLGRPVHTLLAVPEEASQAGALVRVDAVAGRIQVLRVALDRGGEVGRAIAEVTASLGSQRAAALDRLRTATREGLGLEIDHVVVGPASVLARVTPPQRLGPETATEGGASALALIRAAIAWRALAGTTGLIRGLGLVWDLRRFPVGAERTVAGGGPVPDEGADRRWTGRSASWLP